MFSIIVSSFLNIQILVVTITTALQHFRSCENVPMNWFLSGTEHVFSKIIELFEFLQIVNSTLSE